MKNRLLIVLGFFLFSCSASKDASKIAENFCNCNDSILNGNEDITAKKVKLEGCYFALSKEIESETKDLTLRNILTSNVTNLIKKKCPNFFNVKELFNDKRSIADNLIMNPSKCKDYFIDGNYIPVGINVPVLIIRKGTENIVKYVDSGCESVFDIKWIDDCKYYLILKRSNCQDQKNMVGDSMLIRVIDIKNDTIHYEVDINSQTFPQIMKRINN